MSADPLRILVIDDEEPIRDFIMLALRKAGYSVRAVEDGEQGLKELLTTTFDLVLCDVRMPRLGGLELLDTLRERDLHPTIIMMSAFGSRELAIEALKRGAYDYIEKPFKKDELLLTLLKAEERLKLKQENDALREGATGSFHGLIGSSDRMREVFSTITKVAAFTSTVLISGESGTGKELVAKAVHEISPRARGPLVALNCGAIPEQLIESELFGHVRGAFTDAHSDKRGLFQEADGGTIFLDEIAELPLALQVKLLRVLEERQIRRVGDHRSVAIDVRVIAASLHDLAERVQEGLFREDLYYRLNVIQITLPPLRQRREDLPALIQHFVDLQNTRQGTAIRGVTQEALQLMMSYRWPGNVRELQNCIERGVVLTSGTHIGPDVLPAKIRESADAIQQLFSSDELSIKKMSASLERILIQRALERTGNNKTHAAQLLEISQRALHYKIKDYEIDC